MSQDPLRRYLQATQDIDKALDEVRRMTDIIGKVDRELNDKPFSLTVSNAGINFQMLFSPNHHTNNIDGNDWPTAKKIAEVLYELHDKRTVARKAWDALTDSDKRQVKHHPSIA